MKKRKLTALVMCEYSDVVSKALRKKGFITISNDLLPSENPHGWHVQGDCFEVLSNIKELFSITNNKKIDLIIMHPPCTALAVSGNATYAKGKPKYAERLAAIKWTTDLFKAAKAAANYVCMENPVGILPFKPAQYIQPWEFGHTEKKKTGLWLFNLPKLRATNNVYDEMIKLPKKEQEKTWYMSPSPTRGHERSRTYQGIADAMADQFGEFIQTVINTNNILKREQRVTSTHSCSHFRG